MMCLKTTFTSIWIGEAFWLEALAWCLTSSTHSTPVIGTANTLLACPIEIPVAKKHDDIMELFKLLAYEASHCLAMLLEAAGDRFIIKVNVYRGWKSKVTL